MATLILGGVGALVGSSLGGPAGARLGWAVGTTVGGIVDQINKKPVQVKTGNLSDLKYMGSDYGASIPRIWGKMEVAGNVIWSANYVKNKLVATGTTNAVNYVIKQVKKSAGGGGSGGGATQITEEAIASFAVAFCEASTFGDDGGFRNRTHVIKRMWADDTKIYDVDNASLDASNFVFHYGGESEAKDALMVSAEGAANVPAYRGIVYVTIKNFNCAKYGNRIPSIRAEIWTNSVTVGDIFSDVVSQVGLYGNKLNVSAATTPVDGYLLENRSSAQTATDPILSAFAYDATTIDGALTLVPRGLPVVATISENEIGYVDEGESFEAYVSQKRSAKKELPGRVEVTYKDAANSFQNATAYYINNAADTQNPEQIGLNIVMTATKGVQLAARLLQTGFDEVSPLEVVLGHKYRWITTTDRITLSYISNGYYRTATFRVIEIKDTPFQTVSYTIVLDDSGVLTQTITAPGGVVSPPSSTSQPVPVTFEAFSITELREEDQKYPGFYIAGTWTPDGVGGAAYHSPDGGTTWIYDGNLTKRVGIASCTSTLSNTITGSETLNITTVDDGFYAPETTTSAAVSNGDNIAIVGKEIVGFTTSSTTGTNQYQLSGFVKRGIRNSPTNTHVASEKFITATDGILRVNVAESYVGTTMQVKVVPPGLTLDDVTPKSVTIMARNPTLVEILSKTALSPYATPVQVLASDSTSTRSAVDWTTKDVSSYIVSGTAFVALQAVANDVGNPAGRQAIEVRKDSSSTVYTVVEGVIGLNDCDLELIGSVLVPITSSGTFQYRVLVGFGNNWELRMLGGFASASGLNGYSGVGGGGPGSGGVSSVGLSAPTEFGVSGSPVTNSGTLALAWATQAANKFFASPNGGSGTPTFRSIVSADLPDSGATAGSYTNSSVTVDAKGRVTAISSGSGGSSYITAILDTATIDLTVSGSTLQADLIVPGSNGQVLVRSGGTLGASANATVSGTGFRFEGDTTYARIYLGTAAVSGFKGLQFTWASSNTRIDLNYNDPSVAWKDIGIATQGSAFLAVGTSTSPWQMQQVSATSSFAAYPMLTMRSGTASFDLYPFDYLSGTVRGFRIVALGGILAFQQEAFGIRTSTSYGFQIGCADGTKWAVLEGWDCAGFGIQSGFSDVGVGTVPSPIRFAPGRQDRVEIIRSAMSLFRDGTASFKLKYQSGNGSYYFSSSASASMTANVGEVEPANQGILAQAKLTATQSGTDNTLGYRSVPSVLSTTTGINAKTVGTTPLYTVPTGYILVVTAAIIRCTAASSITAGPTLGIGVATNEDDIYSSTALTALTAATKLFGFTTVGVAVQVAAGSVVKLGVDTAATGTSQTIVVDLIGYLVLASTNGTGGDTTAAGTTTGSGGPGGGGVG